MFTACMQWIYCVFSSQTHTYMYFYNLSSFLIINLLSLSMMMSLAFFSLADISVNKRVSKSQEVLWSENLMHQSWQAG